VSSIHSRNAKKNNSCNKVKVGNLKRKIRLRRLGDGNRRGVRGEVTGGGKEQGEVSMGWE